MINESAKLIQRSPCWIAAFKEAAKGIGVPEPYLEWAGIYAVAAALGRHVYSINARGTTYPNLYVMMVGPPGTGKSEAEKVLKPFLVDIGVPLASEHVSKAALIDEINEAGVKKAGKNGVFEYHHLSIVSAEFVQTFPQYDISLLGMLSDWWDCPPAVREKKRHLKEAIIVKNPCCTILTGIQPGLLAQSFPVEAWNGGFLARTIFVYVPQKIELLLRTRKGENKLTYGKKLDDKTRGKLARELGQISTLTGLMEEDATYVDEYLKWREAGQEPKPKHPRLTYYNIRREHQLEKLSIISAAARGSTVMTGADYLQARRWLESTESNLDDIFVEMSSGDDMQVMQDMHAFVVRAAKGANKPYRESAVRRFLTGRVATQRMDSFLEVAVSAGFVKIDIQPGGKMIYALPLEEFR